MSRPAGATIKPLVRVGDTPDSCWQWIGRISETTGHGNGTKLTAQQVAEIKAAKYDHIWGDGAELARKHGVSGALIHDIWNGRAWKD